MANPGIELAKWIKVMPATCCGPQTCNKETGLGQKPVVARLAARVPSEDPDIGGLASAPA